MTGDNSSKVNFSKVVTAADINLIISGLEKLCSALETEKKGFKSTGIINSYNHMIKGYQDVITRLKK